MTSQSPWVWCRTASFITQAVHHAMFLTCSAFFARWNPARVGPINRRRREYCFGPLGELRSRGSGLCCEALAEQYGRREVIRERLSSRHRRAVQRLSLPRAFEPGIENGRPAPTA